MTKLILAPVAGLVVVIAPAVAAQAPKLEGFPAIGEPAVVTVSSTGAEPRTRLRYRVTPKYRGRMEMSMAMGMTMSMAGQAMPQIDVPPIRMTADLAVTEVGSSGDITYTFGFGAIESDDPNIRAAMQQAMAGIGEMKGTVVITDRGMMRKGAFDLEKIANPQVRQTMGSVYDSLRSMSMPLPEEAVGVGARWQVRQSMVSNGIHSGQKIDVELTGVTATTAVLKVSLEQHAPQQTVALPQLPGANVTLQKMEGSGTGTINIALDGLVPTSDLTSRTNSVMDIDANGNRQSMGVDVTIKVKIAPGK